MSELSQFEIIAFFAVAVPWFFCLRSLFIQSDLRWQIKQLQSNTSQPRSSWVKDYYHEKKVEEFQEELKAIKQHFRIQVVDVPKHKEIVKL